jgi:hypothetical protein
MVNAARIARTCIGDRPPGEEESIGEREGAAEQQQWEEQQLRFVVVLVDGRAGGRRGGPREWEWEWRTGEWERRAATHERVRQERTRAGECGGDCLGLDGAAEAEARDGWCERERR